MRVAGCTDAHVGHAYLVDSEARLEMRDELGQVLDKGVGAAEVAGHRLGKDLRGEHLPRRHQHAIRASSADERDGRRAPPG